MEFQVEKYSPPGADEIPDDAGTFDVKSWSPTL